MKSEKRENTKNAQIVTNQAVATNLLPAITLLQAVDAEAAVFIQAILAKPEESWTNDEVTAVEQMVIAAEQLELVPTMSATRIKADLDRLKSERSN
jgi:hypothetical protein